MSPEDLTRTGQSSRVRLLLPSAAVLAFLAMVAVAEYQIRSSPEWPPPAMHEAGGWQVDDPPLWTLAASLNLPATVPILWMAAVSDRFTFALDDHHLIVYVPWTFFVFWLWYFVAYHIDWSVHTRSRSATKSLLLFSAQALITVELIYCEVGIIARSPVNHPLPTPIVVVVCFWAWVLAAIIGWVTLIRHRRNMTT